MTSAKPFAQAEFLVYLEQADISLPVIVSEMMPTSLARAFCLSDGKRQLTEAGQHLIALLKARLAMLQASFDTELAADELRRYQKFAKLGQPSPHIVGLRQKQAAARQATSVAKQSLVRAAAAFVREAGIDVPPRVALDVFIVSWIDANVPKTFPAAS
jgi:hypothetical protein